MSELPPPPNSWMTGCYVKGRGDGDASVKIVAENRFDGLLYIHQIQLDGYAILPIEEFNQLLKKAGYDPVTIPKPEV